MDSGKKNPIHFQKNKFQFTLNQIGPRLIKVAEEYHLSIFWFWSRG